MGAITALLLLLPQEAMSDLLRRLRDDDPAARDGAAAALLEGWETWSEEDLRGLRASAADADVELAARARGTALRIDIRRRLGRAALDELKGIDADLLRGTPEQRVAALKHAATLAELGRIEEDALLRLVRLAAEQRWPLPLREVLLIAITCPRPFAPLAALGVGHPDPDLAASAVDLLERSGSLEHHGALVARLGDPRLEVVCADVLGHTGARALAPAVAEKVRQGSARAAQVLGRMGAVAYAKDVAALLASTDPDTLRLAVEALGRMSAAAHAADLAPLLAHEDAFVRAEAAWALGRMGTGAATLLPLLKDRDGRVQAAAADALAWIGDRSVVEDVAALLAERDTSRLGFAAQVLGRLGAKDRADAIAALLRHNQPWTRAQAVRALARLGSLRHLDLLIELVDDEWDLVRTTAAVALGEMADLDWPAASRAEAAKRLRTASLKDPTAETRLAAAAAALRLDGPDAEIERRLLQDVEAGDPDAPGALLETLSRLHEAEGRSRLDREIVLPVPADGAAELQKAAAQAGLILEIPEGYRVCGRMPAGKTTLRRLLAGFWDGAVPQIEVKSVRPLSVPDALAAWRKLYPRNK